MTVGPGGSWMGLPPEVVHLGYSLVRDAIASAAPRRAECSCHCPSPPALVDASCGALERLVERCVSAAPEPENPQAFFIALIVAAFVLGCLVGLVCAHFPLGAR